MPIDLVALLELGWKRPDIPEDYYGLWLDDEADQFESLEIVEVEEDEDEEEGLDHKPR